MDPSIIFLIAAGAIILVGRTINRIAERNGQEIEDNTPSFDAQHEFDGEEAIPARPKTSEEETLAGTILAQILAERHAKEMREQMSQTMTPTQTRAPKFTSNASGTTPKAKRNNKAKAQSKTSQKEIAIEKGSGTLSSDLVEDFDLRKAVIYSEILKPKFDE